MIPSLADEYPSLRYGSYVLMYAFTIAIMASPLLLPAITVPMSLPFISLQNIVAFFALAFMGRYLLYLIFASWYDVVREIKFQEHVHKAQITDPKVSVVIPAWNEEVNLIDVIKHVLYSSYHNLEIIVVNDGSTDNSDKLMREFMESYAARNPDAPKILYAYIPNGGKGNALNTGIAMSTGSIIVTIDADTIVDPHAIRAFVDHFADPRTMAVAGNIKIGNTRTFLGGLQYLEYLLSFHFRKADSVMNTIYVIGGAAGAYRREVFKKIGMFSVHTLTEDMDMSVRIQKANMKIEYADNAIVYTEGATDRISLAQQRLRWKRGRFETLLKHKLLFFRMRGNNKLLSWLVLPFSIFGDVQLSFDICFIVALYALALMTHDFSLFIATISTVTFLFFMLIAFNAESRGRWKFYFLAPISWLMFYVATFIESEALVKSMWGVYRGTKHTWQRWQRRGCDDRILVRSKI